MDRRIFMLGSATAALSAATEARAVQLPAAVTITGHRGNIGARLVQYFKAPDLDYVVHGIDKKDGKEFDLSDWSNNRSWPVHPSVTLIHLAATANPDASREDVEKNNIVTLINVIKTGVRRVIFASSTFAEPSRYGNPWRDSDQPAGWYGLSKFSCEQIGTAALVLGKLDQFTVVRIGWVPPLDWPEGVTPNKDPKISDFLTKIRIDNRTLCRAFFAALTQPPGWHLDVVGDKITERKA